MSPRGTREPDDPPRARPTDGAVVYRTRWRDDLESAAAAVRRAGIPAALEWRDTHMPAGFHARAQEGDGEGWVVVPASALARARGVLRSWRSVTDARLQGHMRDVRWQLAFVLFLAALAVGIVPVIRVASQQPAWPIAYGLVMLGLGAYVFRAWRKSRDRARS